MENQLLCLDSTPKFLNLFDFGVAPSLLFYSYIPVLIIVIFFSTLILFKDKFSLQSKALFTIGFSFSLWIINMIFQWIGVDANFVIFSWQITALIEIMIPISVIYFNLILINKGKDISVISKLILLLMSFPIFILLPTSYNIINFDLSTCAGDVGPLLYYVYGLEIISMFWITIYVVYKLYKEKTKRTLEYIRLNRLMYIIIGSAIFLLIFSLSNTFGEITKIYEINLFGPIGMLIFVTLLTYHIVKFKTFHLKVLVSEALVAGLFILIGAQFFFIKVKINFILNGISFLGIIILGNNLIKGVKKEIEQREGLEVLRVKLEETNMNLAEANDKLKDLDKLKTEFVSLASHQLRSPLTAIKGYASMVIEGDYGEVNKDATGAIKRVFESSQNLSKIVEDLLDVSKIEQGGMKYEMTPFNLADVARDMTKDLSIPAENKGLKLNFKVENEDKCVVNGDKEKIRQVILNFIDNSIKYTKEGEINVSVKKESHKIIFIVSDMGMGMTPEIKSSLFQKFVRGDGARMNTTGSGLGLYLAKEIVEAHKGRVWVESEGPNKGSTFYMELEAVE